MARGRKNLTLDEQLAKITTEIENMETSLKEMKQAKKELEDQIRQTRLAELDEIISEKGLSFEEVKKIFDFFGWLFVGTLLLTAAAAFYFIKKHAWLWLRIAGILCIALPAFLGLMVAVNWDYVFVTFHQLVFNNDYWLFDSSTDPIIDILPDGYFMHCAIMIFALVFVGSFLCFIFSHLLKRRSG